MQALFSQLSHDGQFAQLERRPLTLTPRRHEFIDLTTLVLLRTLAGPRASRRRRIVFKQTNQTR
jgi:hypothetical protein